MTKKFKKGTVYTSLALLVLCVLTVIVSSMGVMAQSVKMSRLKTEHLVLTTSLTLNELSVGLRESDILEEEQGLLLYLKEEDSLIEGIQSVERKNDYLYIDVILANHEVKKVAYPMTNIYKNMPSLAEKEKKQDLTNQKRQKKLETELKENEEKHAVIEKNRMIFRKINFMYWLKQD